MFLLLACSLLAWLSRAHAEDSCSAEKCSMFQSSSLLMTKKSLQTHTVGTETNESSSTHTLGTTANMSSQTYVYDAQNQTEAQMAQVSANLSSAAPDGTIIKVGPHHHPSGSSGACEKVVELPENDMLAGPDPQNKQYPGWTDRFKVTVKGKKMIVKRIDKSPCEGWGQDLRLRVWRKPSGQGKINIRVGASGACKKVFVLPEEGMSASSKPRNEQMPWWQDRFAVTVEGKKMIVRRIDKSPCQGWGQDLKLAVWRKPQTGDGDHSGDGDGAGDKPSHG